MSPIPSFIINNLPLPYGRVNIKIYLYYRLVLAICLSYNNYEIDLINEKSIPALFARKFLRKLVQLIDIVNPQPLVGIRGGDD